MSVIRWDPPKRQCEGEEKERAKRMCHFLKVSKITAIEISKATGICKSTAQRYVGDPPGLPSKKALKILEDKYGAQ